LIPGKIGEGTDSEPVSYPIAGAESENLVHVRAIAEVIIVHDYAGNRIHDKRAAQTRQIADVRFVIVALRLFRKRRNTQVRPHADRKLLSTTVTNRQLRANSKKVVPVKFFPMLVRQTVEIVERAQRQIVKLRQIIDEPRDHVQALEI